MSIEPPNVYYTRESSVSYSALSPLNTLDIHLPLHSSPQVVRSKYWIIYIHGGAWRDPLITSKSIEPSLPYLCPSDLPVAGIVALNYRLSPYPAHPTMPSTPSDAARNVRHPAHVEDVLAAIAWLQVRYRFGEEYLIIGHSCGASLAFQVAMGSWDHLTNLNESTPKIQLPCAIVGVEGIYDLVGLRNAYGASEYGALYQAFLGGAFGTNEAAWESASPAVGDYSKSWPNGKLTVLAWSEEDEWVDRRQIITMSGCLDEQKTDRRRDVVIELSGNHDEIWEQGEQLAGVIKMALSKLERREDDIARK